MKIYGISHKKCENYCIYIGVNKKTIYKELPKDKLDTLTKILNYYKKEDTEEDSISKNLYNYRRNQIKMKIEGNTWIGRRLKLGLPTRGQRTRTNAVKKTIKVKKNLSL